MGGQSYPLKVAPYELVLVVFPVTPLADSGVGTVAALIVFDTDTEEFHAE